MHATRWIAVLLALCGALVARAEAGVSEWPNGLSFQSRAATAEMYSRPQRRASSVDPADRTQAYEVARARWEAKRDLARVRLAEALAKAHTALGPKPAWWVKFWHAPWPSEAEKAALEQARDELRRAAGLLEGLQLKDEAARARQQQQLEELERQAVALERLAGSGYARAWQMAFGEAPQEGVERLQVGLIGEDSGAPVEDVTQVAHIEKVVETDLQEGVVGQPLPQPVAVRVTTATGDPVVGAAVTFKRLGAAQPWFMPLDGTTQSSQLTVLTDETGRAAVRLVPDTNIRRDHIRRQGTPFVQLLGYNSVTAETTNGTQTFVVAEPFVQVGLPGPLYQVQAQGTVSFYSEAGVQLLAPVAARALDQYGNARANELVTWTQAPSTGRFFRYQDVTTPQVLDPSNPMQLQSLQEWTETDGWLSAGYIPGPSADSHTLTATVGSRSCQFFVSAFVPSSPRYTFRTTNNSDFDGVYGTSGPHVMTAQILRWPDGAPGWTPVRGDEPGLQNVAVGIWTLDEFDNVLAYYGAAPVTTGPEPVDDETSVAFRPKFLVPEGWQRVYFVGQVFELDSEGQPDKVCCNRDLFSWNWSANPTLDPYRRLRGGAWELANGQGLTTDTGVGFKAVNNSSDQLYVRVEVVPAVPGDEVLVIPDTLPLDGDGHIVLPSNVTANRMLPLVAGNKGGRVRFTLYAKDYATSPPAKVLRSVDEVVIAPPPNDILLAGLPLRARWVLPAWDFASARKSDPQQPPPEDAQAPIAYPTTLGVKVYTAGLLELRQAGTVVATAQVRTDATGITQVTPVSGTPIALAGDGYVVVELSPGAVGAEPVRVTLVPQDSTQASFSKDATLTTTVGTVGKLPVSHTFVKDVSLVDGHLVKQSSDVEVPSRGLGLSWLRTYSSGEADDGLLGRGWSHSYEGAVMQAGTGYRFVVSGGEGGGQVFNCTGDGVGCVPQRGHHGMLRAEGTGAGRAYIYRAKNGVEYHHGRQDTAVFPARYRLTSVVAPTGHKVELRYGDISVEGALTRVYDEASGRLLQLGYERLAGRLKLRTVELRHAASADATSTAFLGVCLQYDYDSQQRLATASRYDGTCGSGSPLRTESYEYMEGASEVGRTRLSLHTGPNGEETRYTYYSSTDVFPGEDAYLLLLNKDERVKSVVEVLERSPQREATTTFTYSIAPEQRTVLGQALTTYATAVKGPRPEVPESLYRMIATGAVVETEKPLSQGVVARTAALWNPLHRVRETEADERGRVTRFTYDAKGNLIARRIEGTALPASGTAAATLPVVDAEGQPVAEVVEKWGYEAGFNARVCHVDAEGYATVSRVDSTGEAPEDVLPLGTGRLLETRRYAARVPRQVLTSTATCEEAVAALTPSPEDVVLSWRYCGVESATCPTNARTGDWVATVGADGHLEQATAYDAYGHLESKTLQVSGASTVTVQYTYDARGRLEEEEDGLGRREVHQWDGLDRVSKEERWNFGQLGLTRTLEYYPGGQLKREEVGTDFVREHTLDAASRLAHTVESGGGLPTPLETHFTHDEAGNRTSVTDRRGVLTTTVYDFANRPEEVIVSVADGPRFTSQGGSPDEVGRSRTVSRVRHDAAGNKVWEADVHGFDRTYRLDSLYRVVEETSPEVPGATGGAPRLRYTQTSRYDLRGQRVRHVDGNSQVRTAEFDLLGRTTVQTDAVGRVERRRYDGRGNVTEVRWEAGGVQHRQQNMTYDGLSRLLTRTERVAKEQGEDVYETQTVYDDVAHVEWTRNARGFLEARHLDGLGRVFRVVVDAASGPLARQPDDSRAGPALGLTSTVEYDAYGHEAARVDALGRRTETVHDALGRLVTVNRPMGVSETQVHDGEGHVILSVDGRGVERHFTHDALERPRDEVLVESLSQNGQPLTVTSRTYVDAPDSEGLTREEVRDARQNLTGVYRDGLQREVRRVDALSHASHTRFDALYKREKEDAKGYVTRFTYDGEGRPLSQSEYRVGGSTLAYTQTWTYTDASREQTHLNRRSLPTRTVLDGLERKVRSVRGQGLEVAEESWEYNAAGLPVRLVDANGYETNRAYDGAGRLVEETLGAGTLESATTTFRYDAAGQLTQTKGPRVTGVAFDARYTYDDLGRRVREEDALGNVKVQAHDAVGNLACAKQPLGQPTLAHGAAGGLTLAQVQSHACGGSYVTRYAYDEVGKLVSVTDAAGGVTSFVYDATRNLVAKQDANGHLTTYEYDARNLRTGEHQHLDAHARLSASQRASVPLFEGGATPSGSTGTLTWRTTYDANGNPDSLLDPKGQHTQYVHGVLDRLDSRTYSQHAAPRELPSVDLDSFSYDGNGNLTREVQLKQTAEGAVTEAVTYTHDALDRRKTRLQERDGKLLSYEYDPMGHRTRVEDSDGVATTYEYDALGRLKEATIPTGTVQYTYWPDSLPKGTQWSNGLVEGRCYDAAGRLAQLMVSWGAVSDTCGPSGQIVSSHAYTYDANGNRRTQLETRTSPETQVPEPQEATSYGYDALDRLTGVAMPEGFIWLYRLDAVGNRTGERQATSVSCSGTESLASLAAGGSAAGGGQALPLPSWCLGPAAYTSVPSNSLLRDVTATFNRADWLRGLEDAKDATRSAAFAYDLVGNLVEKQTQSGTRTLAWDIRNTLTAVRDNGLEVGRYDYDVRLQRTRRLTATENVAYVLDDGFVLQEADGSQTSLPTKRRYHYGKRPLGVTDVGVANETRFLATDALGSVTDAVTTQGSTVVAARQYDAWGNHRNGSAPGAGDFKLGYTGHQLDVETGLTYARARYYDSQLGRFISRDSYEGQLGDAPSLHRYAYAHGNPLRFIDTSGFNADPVVNPVPTNTCDARPTACPAAMGRTAAKLPAGPQPPTGWDQLLVLLGLKAYADQQSAEAMQEVQTQIQAERGEYYTPERLAELRAKALERKEREVLEAPSGPGTTSLPRGAPGAQSEAAPYSAPGAGGGVAYAPGRTGQAQGAPGASGGSPALAPGANSGAEPMDASGAKTPHYRGPRAAPKTWEPNSVWETTYPNGNRRITYFDENGQELTREDYGQDAPHRVNIDGTRYNLNRVPHEHRLNVVKGPKGNEYKKHQVRILDADGNPITPWVNSGPD
uniref:Rhs family protein n=1 Tax=Pyxidicoccus sp. TaxID=2023737 RepID=A0A3S5GXT9_9BACT|nr:hypothetical protein [Pyxidicoccus sp.]